jgi:hypothetical protein
VNLSIFVHTFNGYQWLWRGCLDGWKEQSLPDELPMYWGTDTQAHDSHDFGRFSVRYSGDDNWSSRLVTLLSQIGTKYVFYAQEDHWPVKSVPDLGKMMDLVVKNDLLRLQISPVTRYYKLKNGNGFSYFDPGSKYLVSHQPSIWDRQFFLDQIRYNESPWINEYEGTKRLNHTTQGQRIGIYDHNWFHHACVKGEFQPLSGLSGG